MRKLLMVLILCGAAMAADTREGKVTADALVLTSTNPIGLNASAALHTLPFKVGLVAGLPATCTVGERYFASNPTTVGQNTYSCTALNTWTLDFGAGIIVSSGTVDFGSAGHTRPAKVGLIAALPALCTVGEVYFATDATAGRNWYFCTALNTWTQQVSNAGTVTSVTMTVPAFMNVTGSPLTSSGTLAVTFNNQAQGAVFIGPASGSGQPSFRVLLANDVSTTGQQDSSAALAGDMAWRQWPRKLDKQDVVAGINGNSADQTIYTYSMPSGTMLAGTCVRVTFFVLRTAGAGSPAEKIFFGGTTIVTNSPGGAGPHALRALICNNAGSTTAQWGSGEFFSTLPSYTSSNTTPAENTNSGSPIVIKGTFNVAAGTSVGGTGWLVEYVP